MASCGALKLSFSSVYFCSLEHELTLTYLLGEACGGGSSRRMVGGLYPIKALCLRIGGRSSLGLKGSWSLPGATDVLSWLRVKH